MSQKRHPIQEGCLGSSSEKRRWRLTHRVWSWLSSGRTSIVHWLVHHFVHSSRRMCHLALAYRPTVRWRTSARMNTWMSSVQSWSQSHTQTERSLWKVKYEFRVWIVLWEVRRSDSSKQIHLFMYTNPNPNPPPGSQRSPVWTGLFPLCLICVRVSTVTVIDWMAFRHEISDTKPTNRPLIVTIMALIPLNFSLWAIILLSPIWVFYVLLRIEDWNRE